MRRGTSDGTYLVAYAETRGVQMKAIAARTGMHPSTISKFCNDVREITVADALKIGEAVGTVLAERSAKTW